MGFARASLGDFKAPLCRNFAELCKALAVGASLGALLGHSLGALLGPQLGAFLGASLEPFARGFARPSLGALLGLH